MRTQTIKLTTLLRATPQRIYDAWLDAKGHTAMTGSKATVESREIGGRFTAWSGYIEGTHVALDPGKRIFQSWRATDFPRDAPESYLEVRLAPAPGGTLVTLRHTELPPKLAAGLQKGWKDFYFRPMAKFFAAEAGRAAPPKPARGKAPGKRTAKGAAPKRTGRKPAAKARPARKAPAKRKAARRPRR